MDGKPSTRKTKFFLTNRKKYDIIKVQGEGQG